MSTRTTGPVRTAISEVDRDAAGDGVGRRLAWSLFWLPAVGAVLVALAAARRPLFLALVREDGPVEWSQFVCFALAAVLLAYGSWRLFRRGDVLGGVLVAIGALGIFGIAGEEISWGQRVFDFGTPEGLSEINHQDEFNVHNITTVPVQRLGNYMQLVLGGAGLVLPWLTRTRRPAVRVPVLRLLSPPLFLTAAFGLMFAYRAVRFAWDSEVLTVVKYGEWPEFCLAFGLFGYALLLVRGLRAAGRGTSPARAATAPDVQETAPPA